MPNVYVYGPYADDFDCLGLCGPLTPTKGEHIEDANGESVIELDHPIDENGRWAFLQEGYVIKAEVPVRTCPEVTEAGALVTALERWNVKPGATKAQRYLYSKSSGGTKKKLLAGGASVVVTQKGASRYKAKTGKYTGWIAIEALENKIDLIVPEEPEAIEQVAPAWSIRPQLFRIYERTQSDDGVKVKARHIFYDLLGNNTTYSADNPTCVDALAGIVDGCLMGHDFAARTNMLDTRIIDPWTRISPVEALLDPEIGLIARWGGELVRDDWEFYVLNRAGMNRGVRIAYGKNMLGVNCTINQTDVITRILPVGQTSKGKPLLLAPGAYTVDGQSVTVDDSLTVISDREIDYPTPHVFTMDLGEDAKATGTSSSALNAARVKMIRAALKKYADEECDLPSVSLRVDFLALGDTEEYAQYRQLEGVFLYDYVRVYHPKIAIDVTAKVNRTRFDFVTGANGRYLGIELGAMRKDMAHTPMAKWQVPSDLPGYKFAADVITDREISLPAIVPAILPTELPDTPFVGQHYTDPIDNVLKRWDGTAWVQVGISTGQFEDLSGAVTTNATHIGQTNEAVALKASSETVNAQGVRISAAEAAISLVPGQINLAVSNVKIGGTQLVSLAGFGIYNGATGDWRDQKQQYAKSPLSFGLNAVHPDVSIASFPGITLVPGQQYTLSMWCWWGKPGGGSRVGRLRWNFARVAPDYDLYYNTSFGFADSTFEDDIPFATPKRYAFTFTLPTGITTTYTDWQLRFVLFENDDAARQFFVSDVKLEEGNKATDWTPHPASPAESLAIGTNYLFNSDGLRINQYLPGNASVPFYTRITAADFSVRRASDNVPVMQAGADDDGNGYVAVNQLRDVSMSGDGHVRVFGTDLLPSMDVGDVIGLAFYNPSAPSLLAKIWYISAEEAATALSLAMGDACQIDMHNDGNLQITGGMGTAWESWMRFTQSSGSARIVTNGTIRPERSGANSLGLSTNRYTRLYCTLSPDVSSDRRLKRDIADITNALELVMMLRARTYRIKTEPDDAPLHTGLIAQEVRAALALLGLDYALLNAENPESLALVYDELIAILIAAVQAQQNQIDALDTRLEALERMVQA